MVERGAPVCAVCGAPGRCRHCGADRFGVERGGAERVAEWAGRIATVAVVAAADGEAVPGPGRVVVGTASAVKDVGPVSLDLVAILDPDRALSWPGVHAGERAVATWMEAAAWAGPRTGGARVLAQTRRAGQPAVQALVRWDPGPFLRSEAASRDAGGFPAGHPVFRIEGTPAMEASLEEVHPVTLLTTSAEGRTVCLVTVRPGGLAELRDRVLGLVREGVVTRVEAEPQV
jgi:primosomal protein N' (replication factor Y)